MITAMLLVLGGAFMLLAAVGLVRLPDLFLRMSATAKAATLGAALMLLGAGLHFGDGAVLARALVIVAFLFLTAPVAAHMIGRAGYRRGCPIWEGTIVDEAEGQLPRVIPSGRQSRLGSRQVEGVRSQNRKSGALANHQTD